MPKMTNVYLLLLENKTIPSFSHLIILLIKDFIILWGCPKLDHQSNLISVIS